SLLIFALLSQFAAAQNCGKYYAFKKGAVSEITYYDKKGKVSAVSNNIVQDIRKDGGGQVASMVSVVRDDKGKTVGESKYDVTCKANVLSIDFKSMVTPQFYEQYKDMEMEFDGTNLDIPDNLSVGSGLPDAKLNIGIKMSGIKMKMNMEMEDRKVTGKEKITTPAGTFDCLVISYTLNIKMGLKSSSTSKQWLAEGVGLVKQEDYNKKGTVTSSSVLTKLKK
ncbi:MAG: hypothetical protein ABIO05_02805, partial [Ferruginibacter sp.]